MKGRGSNKICKTPKLCCILKTPIRRSCDRNKLNNKDGKTLSNKLPPESKEELQIKYNKIRDNIHILHTYILTYIHTYIDNTLKKLKNL